MELIYQIIQILLLFLITLWFFTSICECRSETGWLFKLKKQWALFWVSRRKTISIDLADKMDKLIDGVEGEKHDSCSINFYGSDNKNNFLFLKATNHNDKPAEVVFFVVLEDGRTYELADHPNTVTNDIGYMGWSSVGLKITVLEPARRMRICFNGLLRRGNRTNVDVNTDESDIEHVRFNCIFFCNSRPCLREDFWSTKLQAETLAKNSWRKSKWKEFISNLMTNEMNQFGSIIGQMTFEDSTSIELYLRGMRQCQWDEYDVTLFDSNVFITALDGLGNYLYINVGDLKVGLKNMKLGYLKDPFDDLFPIESLSFDLGQFIERYNSGFDEYTFQFTAKSKQYDAIIKLRRKNQKILYGGYPWDTQYIFDNFDLKLSDTPGYGIVQIWKPYTGSCPFKLTSPKTFIQATVSNQNMQAYTLMFQDERCQCENLVGGKGASLAELSSIKTTQFTVPKGFCVTACALESHINYHKDLSQKIDDFVKVCHGEVAGDSKEYSQRIVDLIQNTPVIDSVKTEILESLKQLDSSNEKSMYAVRSSAVGEDSEDTSAAGQNSTYLGIKNANEVIKYVAHCWASLYTYQSVEYRRQNGLPIKASMGVCVQQMVDAEAAGVMFTRHPMTGNPKEMLITANYGLGEAVVSALVDPDTIIVQRSLTNALSIKTSKIGKKAQKICMNSATGGTQHSDVSNQETSKLSIGSDLTLKLAEIGVFLDQLFNAPRDIEWAIVKNNIYLLQCRPVTALDAWTTFELTHELGSGVPCENDIQTFANLGEVLGFVITPVTMSSVLYGLNISTEANIKRKPTTNTYSQHMFVTNNRCTLNYYGVMLRHVESKITIGTKITEIAVSGHSIVNPEMFEIAQRRNGLLTTRSRMKILLEMFEDVWHSAAQEKLAREIVEKVRLKPIVNNLKKINSMKEIHNELSKLIGDYTTVSSCHSHTSKCSVFYQIMLVSILAEGNDDLSAEHYSDVALLLGSCSDVISAQVPIDLKKITNTIKESNLGEEFKNIEVLQAMNWLQSNCTKAYDQIQDFLKVHGHRGVDEFEIMTETWSMKPEKFLATIQAMINIAKEDIVPRKEFTPAETVAQLQTPKKSGTRFVIRLLLPAMRKSVARREATKCLLIELVHHMRLGYRRLAELLVHTGKLPDESLVFFLTHQELGELIEEPHPNLLRKAVRRKRIRPTLQKYRYKEINYGMPKPIEMTKVKVENGVGPRVEGTSVCNGIVTGRACVALNLNEAADIQPGDILITTATDIGWSPYFPLLGGVVTELGGLISHGAVVAREYGLPCIVGAENVTNVFKTGDTVTLNGNAGTIEVVNIIDKQDL